MLGTFSIARQGRTGRLAWVGVGVAAGITAGLLAAAPASNAAASSAAQSQAAFLGDGYVWAVVDHNGALRRSDGNVVSTKKLGETLDGVSYEVVFNRDVSACSYAATSVAAFPGDIANAGKGIAVAPKSTNVNALVVKTRDVIDDAITLNAQSFSLQVDCI